MRSLLTAHLIAALLLLSWIFPPTALWWDALDAHTFRLFNGSLVDHPRLQLFWALLCARALDIPVAACLGLFCYLYCFRTGGASLERVARLTYMGLFLSTAVWLSHIVLFEGFHYFRLSPSFAMEAEVWLSRTVDIGLSIRDKSRHSFPSDHGVQLYYWTLFFWKFGGRRLGIPALTLTLLLSFPRLFSGAHWVTDSLIGSLSLVLVTWSWALSMPLFSWWLRGVYAVSSAAKGIATRAWSASPK